MAPRKFLSVASLFIIVWNIKASTILKEHYYDTCKTLWGSWNKLIELTGYGGGHKCFCQFLKILMVSDKTIHKVLEFIKLCKQSPLEILSSLFIKTILLALKALFNNVSTLKKIWAAWPYMLSVSLIWCKNEALKVAWKASLCASRKWKYSSDWVYHPDFSHRLFLVG